MVEAGVRIRVAGTGDVERIVGLNCALFREDAGRRDPFTDQGWPEREGEGHFGDLLVWEGGLSLVAESDGGVVGYLAGYVGAATSSRPVAVAELESMYVAEGYRDSGVGTRMVGEFLAWAAARGVERASVTAHAANEDAIRFYRRNGFRPKSLTLERSVG